MMLDLAMPGVSGLSGLMMMRAEYPAIPVAVVSATDDAATIRRALDLGASGFISKSSGFDDIRAAIAAVLEAASTPAGIRGRRDQDNEIDALIGRLKTLTPQQTRVLGMIGEGLLNKQIAYELGVSEATVKAHVSAILLKLDVDSPYPGRHPDRQDRRGAAAGELTHRILFSHPLLALRDMVKIRASDH